MTRIKRCIIVAPVKILKKCPPSTIDGLMQVVNNGYDKQVKKYNLVQTPRIHDVGTFFSDLGIDANDSMLYIMVNDINDVSSKLECIKTTDQHKWYELKEVYSYNFSVENITATAGYKLLPAKKYPNACEVTGFTSFAKRCGLDLFNYTLPDFKYRYPDRTQIIIMVIVEHELVSYYEQKLGFKEFDRTLIKLSELRASGFEESFMASRDFQISSMKRNIEI